MKFQCLLPLVAGVALLSGVPAQAGLVYNITYTTAVQNDANFAAIKTAVNFVGAEFSSIFSDNITLNYTIDEGAVGLGQSLFSTNYFRGSYAALRAALVADAKSANDVTATAIANLPAAAPYAPGGSLNATNDWYATSSQAKALGLTLPGAATLSDGTYTFDNTVGYTFDSNNRGVAGKFDFIGVTEHEFSELMGRTQQNGTTFGYNIFDTMRFTAAGTRNVDPAGTGVYFSFDNGSTSLAKFNSGAGDKQDLDGTVSTDPFNANAGTNQAHSLNTADIQSLDVIGYDLVATPEPSTFVPLIALFGMGLVQLRKRAKV